MLIELFGGLCHTVKKGRAFMGLNLNAKKLQTVLLDIIFWGRSSSLLLFIMHMIPFTQILRRVYVDIPLKLLENLNYLLFEDNLKLLAKNNGLLETNGLLSIVI